MPCLIPPIGRHPAAARTFTRIFVLVLAALVGVSTTALADDGVSDEAGPALPVIAAGKYAPQATVVFKPGNKRSIGELDLFIPFIQTDVNMLFVDLIGRADFNNSREGNFGLDYRHLVRGGWNLVAGAYAFADLRSTEAGNTFLQATLGLEALAAEWEARANVYLPELAEKGGSAGSGGDAAVIVENNDIFMLLGAGEVALPGFDLEGGFRLDLADVGYPWLDPARYGLGWLGRRNEIRALFGGFWFDRRNVDAVAGPRLRLELRFDDMDLPLRGSRLSVGMEGQWDQARDVQVFGLMSLTVPFAQPPKGQPRQSRLERRMTEPVRRDVDIVTVDAPSQGDGREQVINPHTGEVIESIYFAEEGATGSGVETDPTDLDTAITEAGANSMVVVDGSGGTLSSGTTATLQEGQILIGGASSLTVTGATSGRSGTYQAPGTRPTFNGSSAGVDVLTMARLATLKGINVTGGNRGVYANVADTLLFEDVSISNTNAEGIRLEGASDGASLTSVTVTNAGTDGITVESSSAPQISGAVVTTPGRHGILVNNSPGAVVSGSTVTSSGNQGIRVAGTSDGSTISGNTTLNTGRQGIFGVANNLLITGNSVTNAGGPGIRVQARDNITISNNTVDTTVNNGITALSGTNITISGNTVRNTGVEGIGIEGSSNVDISNNSFDNIASDVLENVTPATGLSGSGNVATNFGNLCNLSTTDGSSVSFTTPAATTCP